MVNNNLVGGWFLPLWNIWLRQLGWLYIPNIWKNKIHVPILKPLANIFIEDLIEDGDFMEIFGGSNDYNGI